MAELRMTYDEQAVAAYAYLQKIAPGEVASTVQATDKVNLDFDARGRSLGIEVLGSSILPEQIIREAARIG